MKATQKLHELGQSLWLDNITRDLLTKGTLKHYIDELSVTGLTSNPTIFDHAIKNSPAYDAAIRKKLKEGKSGRGCSSSWRWRISPRPPTCFDPSGRRRTAWTAGCRWRCRRCWPMTRPALWLRPRSCMRGPGDRNLFIKIPGTKEGLPAIEEAIFAGVPVNVTLLFSREHYVAAAEAFLRGIERRIDAGLNPNVGSVASVFISRWDGAVMDKVPDGAARPARHRHRQAHLQGIPRPARLAALAARLQRRRPPATPPVGQHRNQGPSSLRCPVHQGPRRGLHGKYHARRHLESPRRSRRDWPPDAGGRRRLRGGVDGVCQGWHRHRRLGRPTPGRRGEVIRKVLERTHGGDRLQERRPGESRLASTPGAA